MKKALFFAVLAGFSHFMSAQTIKNIPWMHRSDMVLGSEVIRLGVKEVYQKNELTYMFELSLNEKLDTFSMLANNFVKGEYLENLFLVKLRRSYNKIKTPLNSESARSQKFVQDIGAKNGKINDLDKLELEIHYDKLIERNDLEQLAELLHTLYASTSSEIESNNWVEDKIKQLAAVKREKEADFTKDLESNGRAFLNAVIDILTKRALQGGKVGVLYVTDTVLMRWYRPCDTMKIDTIKGDPIKLDTTKRILHNKPFSIKEVEVKFESNQLASIAIKGYLYGNQKKVVTFHNRKPIAFATKFDASFDYHILKDIRVYCKDKEADGYYILLADVLYNDYKLSNYTNNYSPIDTVISLLPLQPGKVIFRERITDILQARVYSDVIGYGDNYPNGLVQVEFSKLINLKSGSGRQKGNSSKCNEKVEAINKPADKDSLENIYDKIKKWVNGNRYKKIETKEWFRYTIPSIAVTKIEQNDKYLEVGFNTDSTGIIRPIDLLQYSNFKAGIQHNIFLFGRPEYHSNFAWDISIYSILTGTSTSMTQLDSTETNGIKTFFSEKIQNQSRALSFLVAPVDFSWNLYPHSNYHFNFNYRLQYLFEANEKYSFLEKDRKLGQWIHQMGMTGGIKFNEASNGELFARVMVNLNAVYLDQNFYQFQVGYAFKVFSRRPEIKNRTIFN